MEPAVVPNVKETSLGTEELLSHALSVLSDLRQSVSGAERIDARHTESIQSLGNLVELHAAASAAWFVDRSTQQLIGDLLAQIPLPGQLSERHVQSLEAVASAIPSQLTSSALEVLGYRVNKKCAGRDAFVNQYELAQFAFPPSDSLVRKESALDSLPQHLTGKQLVNVIESSFERLHQTLNYAFLEIARFATSERPLPKAEVLSKLLAARDSRDQFLKLLEYSAENSQKIFWQGEREIGNQRASTPVIDGKIELYFAHDGFRLGRLERAKSEFKIRSDALFELGECFLTGASPRHPILTQRYGLGGENRLEQDSSDFLPLIVMEAIADDVEAAFNGLKREALRTSADRGRMSNANQSASVLPYVKPETLEICAEIECQVYRDRLPIELLSRCVDLANGSVRQDPLDPALTRGGLTRSVDLDKLSELIEGKEVRLSTITMAGQIAAFELVVLGRETFSHEDFMSYAAAHPFHAKKSGYLKLAIAAPELLREFIARGIEESPFDILHRRMISELQARNEGITAPPHKTRYLLTQIRTEPVANRASVNAAMRNYGLETGIVTSSVEDDGIGRTLEFFLLPLSFSGFFNTHLNY